MLQMSRTVFAKVCCPVELYGGTYELYFLYNYSNTHNLGAQIVLRCVLRFNKSLTRVAIQAKGPDGKWTRKPLAYRESNNVHLLITRPPEIFVYLVFKHIHAASRLFDIIV